MKRFANLKRLGFFTRLLDETDARLAINAGRTVFHYLDAKMEAWRAEQAKATRTAPAVTDDDMPF